MMAHPFLPMTNEMLKKLTRVMQDSISTAKFSEPRFVLAIPKTISNFRIKLAEFRNQPASIAPLITVLSPNPINSLKSGNPGAARPLVMDTHPVRVVRENIMHQAVKGASPGIQIRYAL